MNNDSILEQSRFEVGGVIEMEEKYFDLLNGYISNLVKQIYMIDDLIYNMETAITSLKSEEESIQQELKKLKDLRAEYCCPFKIGDYVKGWDADKEKSAKVIGIYGKGVQPWWTLMVEKDGSPYTLYFVDSNNLVLANVDAE